MTVNPFGFRPIKVHPIKIDDPWGTEKKKITRKPLSQRDRILIWNKEFGTKDEAFCPICKKHKIYRTSFIAGHKKSLKNGGTNNVNNYRPVCTPCNSQMGSMNMRDFIRKYYPEKTTNVTKKRSTTRKTPVKKTSTRTTKK